MIAKRKSLSVPSLSLGQRKPVVRHGLGLRAALLPVAVIYGLIIHVRNQLYNHGWLSCRRLPCRVISVGNITMGGTGKTPVVIAFANWLTTNGRRVGVLSRGYRRQGHAEQVLVSDGVRIFAGPAEAGDEPHLIAKRCAGTVVAVGADRYRLGKWVLDQFPLDCLILDDGFQHRALHRDVDVVLIDGSDILGLQGVLPAGRLREPLSSLTRAQAVLLTRSDARCAADVLDTLRTVVDAKPYPVRFSFDALVHVATGEPVDPGSTRGRRVLAVSGIGNPASFRGLVDELGISSCDELRFPDHHAYTPDDLSQIRDRARCGGAELVVTTEKDAVKLAPFLERNDPFLALRIKTDIDGKAALERLLTGT
jgi:tetraacyldisaccharide 4'-kinase